MARERAHAAAFRLLVEIARSEGGVREEEQLALARYHRVLELPGRAHHGDHALEDGDLPSWRDAPAAERTALMRMLVQVALADGVLHRRERRLLEDFAAKIDVSDFELRALLAAGERELERHARTGRHALRRAALTVALAGLVALACLWWSWPDDLRAADAAFQDLEPRAREALVLIEVEYTLRKPGERDVRRRASGTGFFITPEGVIATNKHVLQPWRSSSQVARLVEQGWSFVHDSDQLFVYPAGARVVDDEGRRVQAGAFAEMRNTVRRLGAGDDRVVDGPHLLDSSDLALLRVVSDTPRATLPLAGTTRVPEVLEPVLVLGFPDGRSQFENGRARPTVARGEVSKVEDMFMIQAQLLPGSSGGPVLDVEGRVLGVATRVVGGSAYGRCIHADYVRALCRELGVALDG